MDAKDFAGESRVKYGMGDVSGAGAGACWGYGKGDGSGRGSDSSWGYGRGYFDIGDGRGSVGGWGYGRGTGSGWGVSR